MKSFEITPSNDATEAIIKFDELAVAADVAQIDEIIALLGRVRAGLRPALPDRVPLDQRIEAIGDPAYWTNLDAETKGTLLMLQHPGFGWLSFLLPPRERERISAQLAEQSRIAADGASAAPSPGLEPGPAIH